MPTFYTDDLDIEPSDYIDNCSRRDITELIQELKDRGYLNGNTQPAAETHPVDEIWMEAVDKISYSRAQLTNEEESLIYKIASRL